MLTDGAYIDHDGRLVAICQCGQPFSGVAHGRCPGRTERRDADGDVVRVETCLCPCHTVHEEDE